MTKLYSIKGLQALLICLSLLVSSSIQAQVPSYVPVDGLVGYWPFNGNANDESGNGNDGTVNGATLTEDRNGVLNAAYSFDGVNDYIVSNTQNFNLANQMSVGLWVLANSNATDEDYLIGSGNINWLIGIGANGNIPRPKIFLNTTTSTTPFPGYLADNNTGDLSAVTGWHYYVVTYNSQYLKIFIDNVNIKTFTINGGLILFDNLIEIGRCTCGEAYFDGIIDDIGIWNRALTEEEVQALYIGCNVAPTTIAGSSNPFTLTSSNYACNNNPGSTYEWTITNGVITAGQGTSNVTVLWGEEGAGTLTVVETNTEGCSGTPATIEVTIECATTATTLDGPLGPNALTETTYTCNGSANSTFEWAISNGVITSGQGTNSVTVLWAATGLGSISVQETTNANCIGDLISINVVVIPTSIDELNESNLFLYPNPAKEEITLQTNQSSIGSLYIIVDQSGKQIASGKITGTNTTIKLDQFASGMYTIIRDGKTSQQFQVIK